MTVNTWTTFSMENSCLGNGSHSLLFVRGCCWQLCEKGPECLIVNRKKIHTRRAGNTGQSGMLRSRKLSTKWAFHITKACSLGITSELVRNAELEVLPQTYGWKICVFNKLLRLLICAIDWMVSSHPVPMLKPDPQCDMYLEVEPPIKGATENSVAPSNMGGHNEQMVCESESRPSPDPEAPAALIWDFPASRTVGISCFSCPICGVCYSSINWLGHRHVDFTLYFQLLLMASMWSTVWWRHWGLGRFLMEKRLLVIICCKLRLGEDWHKCWASFILAIRNALRTKIFPFIFMYHILRIQRVKGQGRLIKWMDI